MESSVLSWPVCHFLKFCTETAMWICLLVEQPGFFNLLNWVLHLYRLWEHWMYMPGMTWIVTLKLATSILLLGRITHFLLFWPVLLNPLKKYLDLLMLTACSGVVELLKGTEWLVVICCVNVLPVNESLIRLDLKSIMLLILSATLRVTDTAERW